MWADITKPLLGGCEGAWVPSPGGNGLSAPAQLCWALTSTGWGQDPPFERPGFPAVALPRWCLWSTRSLCHSPWDTHCPSHLPKGLSIPLLPLSLPLWAVPFSWHSLPVTTAPVLSTPQSRHCLAALPCPAGALQPPRGPLALSPLHFGALPVGSPGRVWGAPGHRGGEGGSERPLAWPDPAVAGGGMDGGGREAVVCEECARSR